MPQKKLQYHLINILLLILLAIQYSCNIKEHENKVVTATRDLTAINKLLDKGQELYTRQKFDSSFYYYNKAKNAAQIAQDTSRIIHSLSWMAQIQRNQGDYTGSEATSIEALPLIENSDKFPYGQTNVYIGLGNNYLITKDNDNAIFFFKKAINQKTDDIIKTDILNNIGIAYTEKGNYKKAIDIYKNLLLKKDIFNNHEIHAKIKNNLGHIYSLTHNNKAIHLLKEGLSIRIKNKNNWEKIGSNYHIAEYYSDKNSFLSYQYAYKAYTMSTKLKSVDTRLESLKLIIQNCPRADLKKYSLLYLKINDSITDVRRNAKNNFAKIKYDSKKEKEENIKLKEQKTENLLQLEIQKNKTTGLYLIILIILIITLFIYYYLKVKSNREKIQASYKTETQIAKKLHDELANDVYQMMKFAETQDLSTPKNKKTLLNSLDTVYDRTRNISKENNTIETGVYFDRNLKMMISDFNTATTSVVINNLEAVDWTKINSTKKISLYRIIQELLVNMKKHSQCSIAILSFKIDKGKLQLNYTDNGIGLSYISNNKNSGLNNIKRRIQTIKGSIDLNQHSKSGCKINIQFPV